MCAILRYFHTVGIQHFTGVFVTADMLSNKEEVLARSKKVLSVLKMGLWFWSCCAILALAISLREPVYPDSLRLEARRSESRIRDDMSNESVAKLVTAIFVICT